MCSEDDSEEEPLTVGTTFPEFFGLVQGVGKIVVQRPASMLDAIRIFLVDKDCMVQKKQNEVHFRDVRT